MKKRGRPPLPPGQRKQRITVRLRPNLIKWLRQRGEISATVETALEKLRRL